MKKIVLFLAVILILSLLPQWVAGSTQTISVERIAGQTRYDTCVEVSKKLPYNHSQGNLVLTRGDNFPDALVGVPLAKKLNSALLLTYPNSLTDISKTEIIRLLTKYLYVLGSEDAVSNHTIRQALEWIAVPDSYGCERIGGADRYQTSIQINSKMTPPANKTAFIATGENYPDALSASAVAGALGMPIFLTDGNTIYGRDIIEKLGIKNIVIAGGSDVVPKGIEDYFKNNGYSVKRLEGSDRYATSLAIADWAVTQGLSPNQITIATGENFPDALSAGSLNPIILLVRNVDEFSNANNGVYDWTKTNKIQKVQIIGGIDVVNDSIERKIRDIYNVELPPPQSDNTREYQVDTGVVNIPWLEYPSLKPIWPPDGSEYGLRSGYTTIVSGIHIRFNATKTTENGTTLNILNFNTAGRPCGEYYLGVINEKGWCDELASIFYHLVRICYDKQNGIVNVGLSDLSNDYTGYCQGHYGTDYVDPDLTNVKLKYPCFNWYTPFAPDEKHSLFVLFNHEIVKDGKLLITEAHLEGPERINLTFDTWGANMPREFYSWITLTKVGNYDLVWTENGQTHRTRDAVIIIPNP